MSCWKCGKELPPSEVECTDGCQPQAYRELMALGDEPKKLPKFSDKGKEQRALCLTIELYLVESAKSDPRAKAALDRFSGMLGEVLVESGLSEFLRREK